MIRNFHTKLLLLLLSIVSAQWSSAQVNVALTAVCTQSGGGASPNYGPELYNDNYIPVYMGPGLGTWGWLYTNGWIEFDWTAPQTVDSITFYNGGQAQARHFGTAQVQYWNGTAYVTVGTANGTGTEIDGYKFPAPVTTTRIRLNNITGYAPAAGYNPAFREIQIWQKISSGNDAGVTSLSNPSSIFCPGNYDLKVLVKNHGINVINNVTVNWTLNGVAQPSIPLNTPIDTMGGTGLNEVEVLLQSNLSITAPTIVKAWTSNPNNQTDTTNHNDTLLLTLTPTLFTVTASSDTICANSSSSLILGSNTTLPTTGISWQSSTDGGATWTTITGANGSTYSANGLNSPTSFRALVSIDTNQQCISPTKTIQVFQLETPVPIDSSRCGPGPVTIGASVTGPGILSWFDAATGGTSLGTGALFTTPSISTSTTYYVSAGDGGGTADSIQVPLNSGNTAGIYHHMFLVDATSQVTITEIALKVNNAVGTMTSWDIYYRPDNYQLVPGANTSATGWTLLSSTSNVSSMGASAYTTIAQNLNLVIPAGATYSLYIAPVSGTHQYYSPAAGTITASSATMEIRAGHRGSSLFNCSTSGGQAVVKLKTAAGCESPRIPVTATVNNLPQLDLGADVYICPGETATLNANASGTGLTYLWSNNATTPSITVNTAGTYTVAVSNGLCESYDTVEVLAAPVPTAQLPAQVAICDGDNTVLDAGNPGATYSWSDNSTGQTLSVNNAGTYVVNITNSYNCSIADSTEVVVNPLPIVELGNDTFVCANTMLTFDAGNPGASYLWNTGATTQQISVDQMGVYSVIVTNEYNCSASDEIMVATYPEATTNGFGFIPKFEIQAGLVEFFPINPQYVNSYLWNFGDGSTSTQSHPSHQYAASGNYTVSLRVENECGYKDTSLIVAVDLLTGVSVVNAANIQADIYPVPASDKISIVLSDPSVFIKTVKLINVIGQEVLSHKVSHTSDTQISVEQLSNGNYLLLIETDKGTVSRKIVISH